MAEVNKTILIEYDVKTGKFIDENNKAYKSLKQLIDATKQATVESQKMGDVIGQNSQVILGSADHIRKQIQVAKQQREATATNNEEYLRQTMVIVGLEKRLEAITKTTSDVTLAQKKTAQSTRELSKLQENQARSAGLAGAAAFELGRTISDLPFGIVAVTNNISQLGTLFAALVANAKGVKNAFSLLLSQLLGPAGILVAFQAVTSLITVFAQKSNRAKSEVQDLTKSLLEQRTELLLLRKELAQENLTEEERAIILERQKTAVNDLAEAVRLGLIDRARELEILREIDGITEKRREISREDVKNAEANLAITDRIKELEADRARILAEQEEERRRRLPTLTAEQAAEMELGFSQRIEEINNKIAQQEEKSLIVNARKNELNKQIQETTRALNAEVTALVQSQRESNESSEEEQLAIEGTIDFINQQISAIEDQRNAFATTTEEIKAYNEQIDILEGSLRILTEGRPVQVSKLLDITQQGPAFGQNLLEQIEAIIPDSDEMTNYLSAKISGDASKAIIDSMLAKMDSAEEMARRAEMISKIASSLGDILQAQADREIAIEKNKTTALNDQLRRRLANEQLSAEQRDKINQQISRNDAALVEKQNEIAKKQFERDKALKIVMALGDTASTALRAYASQIVPFDPKSVVRAKIAAGIATAFGLAQVAALSRLKYTERALPSPNLVANGGGTTESSTPAFNVVGQSTRNQVAEAVGLALGDQPLKAYVVSSDVTTAQELERKIVEGASI